ncbi:MAG: putative DNA binding domain-containing protein [Planctomycetes bacterium]|nr:putative DNA binding domain-containing protein [Planctomycetota bacterium]
MITSEADLSNALRQGEGQRLEYKLSFQKEVIEVVVAFANAVGGDIILGIDDNAQVQGVSVNSETKKDILNTIKQSTTPNIIVDIQLYEICNKNVIVVSVQEQPIKPVAYKSRYYKRVANSNHLMNLDDISNEHLRSINGSWDYYIDERHSFGDISMDKIVILLGTIEEHQNKTFEDDPLTVLRKYELLKNEQLTFAAYLLFVQNQSAITTFQIGRFKSETHIIDSVSFESDIFSQVSASLSFVEKHLMREYVIDGSAQREERYDYPLEAIREIVINMIVHRDYRDSGHSVIKIFDERIEFFNPGALEGGLSVEQLLSGDYPSRARNRAVARVFKECGYIERYGSGIKRILNVCHKYQLPRPCFESKHNGFKVVLYKNKSAERGKSNEGVSEGVSEGVNEGVNELLMLISRFPGERIPFYSEKASTSSKNIERWMKHLKSQGKVLFRGAPKTGGYYVEGSENPGY